MVYKLFITERAEELLDKLLSYLINDLKNVQAAIHLMDEVSKIYNRLEENPFQFPLCRDFYLRSKSYREAIITDMNYHIIFEIDRNVINILGVFHGLEQYELKL